MFVGAVFVGAALAVNDFGSHKGCRYMIDGYVSIDTALNVKPVVAAPLVGAISSSGSGVGA